MQIQYHSTQNLYEGAFLLAKGFKINGKDEANSKAYVFFEGEGVKDASIAYYNGGLVSAKAFTDAYRTLKDYIFERKSLG